MHINDYIVVHIRKDKWRLLRPPFISSLCISDDLVDDEKLHVYAPALFTAQQQSKYFHLILSLAYSRRSVNEDD